MSTTSTPEKKALRTSLTPEEKALIPVIRERWMNKALYDHSLNEEECKKGVDWMYEAANYPAPRIIYVDSPWEAQVKANELMGRTRPEDFAFEPYAEEGTISSIGWVAFYDFFQEIGDDIGECKDSLNKLKALLLSGVYDMIQLTDVCIVIRKHIAVHLDNSRLHNLDGPAIEFADGFKLYSLHGRISDSWIWTEKDSHTLEKFMQQSNEENRAAMIAVMGGENAVKMLGAVLVSEDHENGETYRLWKTKNTYAAAGNRKLAWVEVECPSTKTRYFIDVHPKWKTALEAVASTWPGETAESYRLDQHT